MKRALSREQPYLLAKTGSVVQDLSVTRPGTGGSAGTEPLPEAPRSRAVRTTTTTLTLTVGGRIITITVVKKQEAVVRVTFDLGVQVNSPVQTRASFSAPAAAGRLVENSQSLTSHL